MTVRAKRLHLWTFLNFGKILSHLSVTLALHAVTLAFRELLEESFSSPSLAPKILVLASRIANICWHKFFHSFVCTHHHKTWKWSSRLHERPILTSCCIIIYGLSITVRFCHLRVLNLPIEFGGGTAKKTLRTAPRRRIVIVVGLKKNRWEKQKSRPSLTSTFASR